MTEEDESALASMPSFLKRNREDERVQTQEQTEPTKEPANLGKILDEMTPQTPVDPTSITGCDASDASQLNKQSSQANASGDAPGGVLNSPPTLEDVVALLKSIDAEILATEQNEAKAIEHYAEMFRSLAARRASAKKLLKTLARKA